MTRKTRIWGRKPVVDQIGSDSGLALNGNSDIREKQMGSRYSALSMSALQNL